MTVRHNPGVLRQLQEELAERLLVAAAMLQTEHMKRLNIGNPAPHKTPAKKGEYPRKRSGFLQRGILIVPSGKQAVSRTMRVRIGYSASAFYGSALAKRGWKGIVETAMSIKDKLKTVLGRRAKIGTGGP